MSLDEKYMLRCLELAQSGAGTTAPNPMVGAVLVFQGRIIGEGWHQEYGAPHAEVNCLNSVSAQNRQWITQSRLYVNLEPCSHFGKTPPCSDLIIREKIPEVVIGCVDSFASVLGQGIRKLQEAGVKVTVGVLEKECRQVNKRFFTRQELGRPYIILKWAESADGYIGQNQKGSIFISGWLENRAVHKMRFEEDAVLVGYQTALNDNPRLNNRFWQQRGRQPVRVLIDFDNSLPEHFHLKDNSQETIIFNFQKERKEGNISWKLLQKNKELSVQIAENLPDINSLIVEGGAKTLQAFIDSRCWDEIYLWRSIGFSMGEGIQSPQIKHAKLAQEWTTAEDRLLKFLPEISL